LAVDDKGSRHILSTLSVEISDGLIVKGEPSDSWQECSLAYARSRMRGDPLSAWRAAAIGWQRHTKMQTKRSRDSRHNLL